MIACPNRAELERFLGLDPVDQAGSSIEEHVNECSTCQSAMQAVLLTPRTMPYPGTPMTRTSELVVAPEGYRLVGLLGRGGVGEVWHAEQDHPRRPVAIKFLHAGAHSGPEVRERFRVEAEAAARVRHPNVVQVYGAGVAPDGSPYMIMEFLGGGSLRERMTGTPWDSRRAAVLVAALGRAVAHAHSLGVVHRDLKPGNVLIDPTPQADGDTPDPVTVGLGFIPKVADFGLAKVVDFDSTLTRTGAIMGTPEYMAPEQAAGYASKVGPRTDVYALGAVLYELLTGRTPFRGESPLATMELIRYEDPVPPRRLNPAVPRDLETICLKCLEKEPKHRYTTAAELAADLERFAAGLPVTARPVGVLGRAWRWRRRNPVVAAMVAALVVLPLLSAAAAGWIAWDMSLKAREQQAARHAEETARQQAELARLQAEQARLKAEKDAQDAEALRVAADLRNRSTGEALLKWADQLRDMPQDISEAEARSRAAENLRQLGRALHDYQTDSGQLPVYPAQLQNAAANWATTILPYLEQGNIYNTMPFVSPARSDSSRGFEWNYMNRLVNPAGGGMSFTPEGMLNFMGGAGNTTSPNTKIYMAPSDTRTQQGNGSWSPSTYSSILDGSSNTIMIGEGLSNTTRGASGFGLWSDPIEDTPPEPNTPPKKQPQSIPVEPPEFSVPGFPDLIPTPDKLIPGLPGAGSPFGGLPGAGNPFGGNPFGGLPGMPGSTPPKPKKK